MKKMEKNYWWYITISENNGAIDILHSLADITESIGTELQEFLQDRDHLRMYYRSDKDLSYWKGLLLDAMKEFKSVKVEDFGKIENQPWNVQAEDAFPPLPVGKELVVLAPWHKGKEPKNKMPLYINPGSAFGTGYHESTQIALELLETNIKQNAILADIGTGSGILTICALKKGAIRAFARDIDPMVIEEVHKNLMLNDLDLAKINLATGDLLKDFKHKVDILTANILIGPLSSMLSDVPSILNEGGVAIFSGMLEREKPLFLEVLERVGMQPIEELVKGEWWGVSAKAKA
ncbi:MAG: 50S ribosomal protein L11 methyltransferase [Synergistaceae bacterium]